jgi:hypothetical protein
MQAPKKAPGGVEARAQPISGFTALSPVTFNSWYRALWEALQGRYQAAAGQAHADLKASKTISDTQASSDSVQGEPVHLCSMVLLLALSCPLCAPSGADRSSVLCKQGVRPDPSCSDGSVQGARLQTGGRFKPRGLSSRVYPTPRSRSWGLRFRVPIPRFHNSSLRAS